MNEKDKTSKNLEQHSDVFADIINTLLFHGEAIIHPSDLHEKSPRSTYFNNRLLFEQERDILKYWVANGVEYALLGLENQTEADHYMPLRTISYDGADYRYQLRTLDDERRTFYKNKQLQQKEHNVSAKKTIFVPKPLYPAITIVLYFGLEEWSAPTALAECLSLPEHLKPYVSDYKINLFQIAFLSDEVINRFQSDFRYVAILLKQTREIKNNQRKQLELTPVQLTHALDTLELLYSMTGDDRFMDTARKIRKGGVSEMYTIFDALEDSGIRIGEERGIKLGEERLQALFAAILRSGKQEDLSTASSASSEALSELYKKYGIE